MTKMLHAAKRLDIFFLTVILCGAFCVRIYSLSTVPFGFFCDEASIGYNAYTLLATGKDDLGNTFPIFFQSLGDFRPPLEIYSTIPFVFLLGVTETATRLPSVFFGLLTIVILYFLGKELYSIQLGLTSAFIAATMPWLMHYNRTGFEFSLYCAFFTLTVLLFLKATHHKKYIVPAFITASLAFYTYQPAKLLIPLLAIGMFAIYGKRYLVHKKALNAGLLAFFFLSLPLFLSFFNGEATARFNMVSVFSEKLPPLEIALRILQNYLTQLSPAYFTKGEPTFISRHFINGLAPFLITTVPFAFIGLIQIALTINKKSSQVLVLWLSLYPIAGAITASAPFTSRSLIGAPLFALVIGIGIISSIKYCRKFITPHISTTIIIILLLINFGFFSQFYFIEYPRYSSNFWGWQYGPRDIIAYFLQNEGQYDELIMEGAFNAPEIFIKFYDPKNICLNKCIIGGVDRYNPQTKQLFAVSSDKMKELGNLHMKIKKTIYYPNKNPAFYIGEIKK